MSLLKGLGKLALGVIEAGKGGIMSDGTTTFCPKCGMPTQGPCKSCAAKNSSRLISEGIKDIKAADEKIYIDAEKRGYVRASKEYAVVFADIQDEYNKAKQRFEGIIRANDIHSEQLISQHEQLAAKRKALEAEVERKTKKLADKSGVSIETVRTVVSGNTFGATSGVDLMAILNSFREKKIREAECKGYNRAKKEYEKKIRALKRDLEELQIMSTQKIEELRNLISDILAAISEEQMKIATLRIME